MVISGCFCDESLGSNRRKGWEALTVSEEEVPWFVVCGIDAVEWFLYFVNRKPA